MYLATEGGDALSSKNFAADTKLCDLPGLLARDLGELNSRAIQLQFPGHDDNVSWRTDKGFTLESVGYSDGDSVSVTVIVVPPAHAPPPAPAPLKVRPRIRTDSAARA